MTLEQEFGPLYSYAWQYWNESSSTLNEVVQHTCKHFNITSTADKDRLRKYLQLKKWVEPLGITKEDSYPLAYQPSGRIDRSIGPGPVKRLIGRQAKSKPNPR